MKYVSWRRVSTKRQGASGLGLAAQKEIIRYFVERENGDWIADYEECYTGTDLDGCVELRKAMAKAKQENAVLIIAKTDRFRNTIEALQVYEEMGEGNLMFCDLPHTDKFTLTLFFALAEREALIVSIRTKQALDAKKARGEKTGGASEKWVKAMERKTDEEKKRDALRRGVTRNERHLASRDVVAFLKVLRNVFPQVCESENANDWDWTEINTKGENKSRILNLMRAYNEMDERVFARWDFSKNDDTLRVKVCAIMQSIRNALKYKATAQL